MKKSLDTLDLFTPEQVATSLGVSGRTVRNWIGSGRLPAARPGGSRYLVSRADLETLLRSSQVIPQPTSPPGELPSTETPSAPPPSAPVAVQPLPAQNELSRAERRRNKLGR